MTGVLLAVKAIGRKSIVLSAFALTAACGNTYAAFDGAMVSQEPLPFVQGSGVRNNVTPMGATLECYGGLLQADARPPLAIAVGDVRDYTGKQAGEEGFVITQGGSLMAYSALGKLLPGITLHERFDTRIADAELSYGSNRQLGDGSEHSIDDPSTGGSTQVPWVPYFGGSVLQSDYFILGGITEVNYNIRSEGSEFRINSIGPKVRTYTMNIAVDLRIVGTQSLRVYDTVSVEKQITGYEIGLGVFRFFDAGLFDVNIGQKSQEPLQFGVRLAIETAILELVESVTNVNSAPCMPQAADTVEI